MSVIRTRGQAAGIQVGNVWIRVLMIGALVCLLSAAGAGVYFALSSSAATQHAQIATSAHKTSVTLDPNQAEVTAVAQQYMNALLGQHYDTMWSMLDPGVQAMWHDEATFASFWKARFQNYTLQNFTTGQAHELPLWVNPETMTQYAHVDAIPVSLQFELKALPPKQFPPLAPQFLHPSIIFHDLPFIVQQVASNQALQDEHQWRVLVGGPADLEAPVLPPLTPVSRRVKVPILMYHHITDVKPKNLLDLSLTVTPTMFNKQLDYLKRQKYQTITFNQLFNALYYNAPLPAKPIILTFDDGYDDAYQFAYPALKAHGYSGMFYIITGKVGWQGQMTWDQMRTMVTGGMQMGSHTIHHVNIGQVFLNSRIQAQQEVQISQMDLEKHLGIVVQQFCYPSGEPFRHGSLILQQQVMNLLAANGYIGATTDPGATGIVQNSRTPLDLLRVRVDGRESLVAFMLSVP
ncbi:MAG TPA: polysaccharide deacetylase family protein [Ktedonosporobacter sp.]|nr:polysaccharide deacetylase family protein [Ktedonosporobacter sp.]